MLSSLGTTTSIVAGAATSLTWSVAGTVYDRYGRKGQSIPWLRENVDPRADRVPNPPKWKYVFPFDPELRRKLEAQALPYPKRGRSDTSDTPGDQPGEGGATPTRPLQSTPP